MSDGKGTVQTGKIWKIKKILLEIRDTFSVYKSIQKLSKTENDPSIKERNFL